MDSINEQIAAGSITRQSTTIRGSANGSPRADERLRAYWVWAVCGLLVLAVGLVFGQTVGHEFIGFDDDGYVAKNEIVAPGLTLAGLWWALTDGPLGEWCPATVVSHMLDCQLYGLNPAGHHLTNVLLHAASSVLLFLVLLRMTGDLWPSGSVAAIFAIHPLHVESVAWAAERRDVLSGLFFMLTLGAYVLYTERPSLSRYLPVALLFALGLMAKPILVTVPFVLLLLDYWPLDRFVRSSDACPPAALASPVGRLPITWWLVMEKIPLLVLSAINCKITMSFHSDSISANPIGRWSLAERLPNALVSYAAYLNQSFYPVDLALFYPLRAHLPIPSVAGSLLLLVAISAVTVYCWRRQPYLPVGWLWFLGMLAPVIGLVPVGGLGHARADRYTYLSQIGFSIALAWVVWRFYQSRQALRPATWRPWTLAVVSATSLLALAAVAWRQTTYWRNVETVWTHAVSCTQQNWVAHTNLVDGCLQQGRTEEAMAHLREALKDDLIVQEKRAMYHLILADILHKHGDVDEALTHYEQTVSLFPSGQRGHSQFAVALASAGQFDRAAAEWHEAIRLTPDLWPARVKFAEALMAQGDVSGAVEQCREVLKQEPGAIKAIVLLGEALADQGKNEEAIRYLGRAVQLDPGRAQAQFRLGLALQATGQSADAIDHLNKAIQLQPDNVAMLRQTAWILATSPDPSIRDGARAIDLAGRVIELSAGRDVRAYDALAAALAEAGKFSAAVDVARNASIMALAQGDEALAETITQRAQLYRQDLPYRQPVSPVHTEDPATEDPPAEAAK